MCRGRVVFSSALWYVFASRYEQQPCFVRGGEKKEIEAERGRLVGLEGFVEGHSSAITDLHSALCEFVAVELQGDGVNSDRHFDARRRRLPGGNTVDRDLRALGSAVHLGPRH